MLFNAEEIGKRIDQIRRSKNWKQKDIYDRAQMSNVAMSNYINGKRIPDTESIYKIAKALEVSIEYLLTGEDFRPELPDQEEKLLELFRQLSPEDKIKIFGYLEAKIPDPLPEQRLKNA